MKFAQHAAHDPKLKKNHRIIQISPVMDIKILKEPPVWMKVATTLDKTGVERRETLGPLRSINPNMINHFIKQSPLLFSKS